MKTQKTLLIILSLFTILILILVLGVQENEKAALKEANVVHEVVIDYTTYEQCISHLKLYEGFRANPYKLDGNWYVGYGQQVQNEFAIYTEAEADIMLRETFDKYIVFVTERYGVYGDKSLALALLFYNVTPTAIINSDLNSLILNGSSDNMAIRNSWISLCKFQGKEHKKLKERRMFEIALYFN